MTFPSVLNPLTRVHLILILLVLWRDPQSGLASMDFLTDNPKITIQVNEEVFGVLNKDDQHKTTKAIELIHFLSKEWQRKFGSLHHHLKINLVPTQRQIDVSGNRMEGVWAWKSFSNEEGSIVLGIIGDLYVNLNSTYVSQEALIAHEASHAFLIAYKPVLLDRASDFGTYNEGLAELFSLEYEPNPWKNWRKLVVAHRFNESFDPKLLSGYGRRILTVLEKKPVMPHDTGFFFLQVVRDGKVDLEKDLKECTNQSIEKEVDQWLDRNRDDYDLRRVWE